MKQIGLFILGVVFTIVSCNTSERQNIEVIDFAKSFDANEAFTLSEISTEVEYIPLETGPDIVIGRNPVAYATKDYILVFTFRRILQFNREDGVFIREIGQVGNGPEEYSRATILTPIDEEVEEIFALTHAKRIAYAYNGEYQGATVLNPDVADVVKLSDNCFAGYLPNFEGNESVKVALYDSLGNVMKTFTNHNIAPNEEGAINIWNPHGWFYKLNNQTFFAEQFNDTLYSINSDQLTARYFLSLGKYSAPYEKQNSMDFASRQSGNYFLFNSVFESQRYLFYTFRYQTQVITGVYDKITQTVGFSTPDSPIVPGGIVDDVNKLVPFSLSSVSNNEELVGLVEAHKVVQWLSENDMHKSPVAQVNSLKLMTESDNPLIVIAKLKQ